MGLRDAGAILERRLQERDEAERRRVRAAEELEEALVREHAARVTGERNEARLLVTMSSIGDAVIATDAEGRVTILNPVAQKMTGWSEEAGDRYADRRRSSSPSTSIRRQPNPSPMAQVDGNRTAPRSCQPRRC